MSRHEGVSCDACLKNNFKGRRYKCLICFDYDLCSACFENGATTNHHATSHAMQCILTRQDFDIFHGGEALTPDQPQSLTCPFCAKMGFTERTLQEHVTANHLDTASEVVCPICASVPGGDPNHVTDDFAAHLTLDHPSGAPRELDVNESTSRHGVRRMQHQGRGLSRGVSRQNMRFGSINSGFITSSSRSDSMDPIAELLSQLSGVRRATASDLLSTAESHLEQSSTRQQQIDRLPTRRTGVHITSSNNIQTHANGVSNGNAIGSALSSSVTSSAPVVVENVQTGVVTSLSANVPSSIATIHQNAPPAHSSGKQQAQSQFLLTRLTESEKEKGGESKSRDRASFVQELLISTLCDLSLEAAGECGEATYSLPVEEDALVSDPLTYDVATQTPHSVPSTPTANNVLNSLPPPLGFTTGAPLTKTSSSSSVPPLLKGPQPHKPQTRVFTRSSPGNVSVPPPASRDAGGAVSPTTSGRRKPVRGGTVDGRASHPPPH